MSRRRLLAVLAIGAVGIALARAGALPASYVERWAVLLENFWVFDARTVDATPANWAVVERMAHWQAGWAMALDHPLVGVGPGNYEAAYPDYYVGSWREPLGHAHNYYVNTFAEQGIVGLLTLVGFVTAIFARLWWGQARALRLGSSFDRKLFIGALGTAVAFSVHNTFDNMFVHGIGVQFGLILGIIEARCSVLGRPQDGAERLEVAPAVRGSGDL